MKKILLLCGSVRNGSTTKSLLEFIKSTSLLAVYEFSIPLDQLPVFHPDHDNSDVELSIRLFRKQMANADGVIIASPEYIHNMPAILKNALEWLTKTGEFVNKKTVVISYTPHEPRGEKSLQSMLYTMTALDAQILASLSLFHTDIAFDDEGHTVQNEMPELLSECLTFFHN